MRKVKIKAGFLNHDNGDHIYCPLTECTGRCEANNCAWFKIKGYWLESMDICLKQCYCGDKLIGELVE